MAKARTIKEALGLSSSAAVQGPVRKNLNSNINLSSFTTVEVPQKPETAQIAPDVEAYSPGNGGKSRDFPKDDFAKNFERKLNSSFKQMSAQLMTEINEIQQRMSVAEERLDDIENLCLDQRHALEELKEANLSLQLKLEDGENRSRRSNIRLRGIPETIQNITSTITTLFQELVPGISSDRLEFDRAHRALSKPKPEGPPRDIIIKFHYFSTKEILLQAAREKSKNGALLFQNIPYQLFSDISPATIERRREMKPSLAVLTANNISYRWGFPFRISFLHRSKWYSASSAASLSALLSELEIRLPNSIKRSREPCSPEASSHKKSSTRENNQSDHSVQSSASIEMG